MHRNRSRGHDGQTSRWARSAGWLALLAGALTCAPTAGAAETWYAQRLATGDAPARVDQLWSKGPKLRAETVVAGHPILTIVSGERYYIVDRLTGSGVAIQRSAAAVKADATRGRPFGDEGERVVEAGAERLRRERLGGRECDLYRVTDSKGRRDVCVSADESRLPLQIQLWSRATGRASTIRYLDWTRNLHIPDGFFAPDPRYRLEHLDYDEYRRRSRKGPVGPAPPFYADLLHGRPDS